MTKEEFNRAKEINRKIKNIEHYFDATTDTDYTLPYLVSRTALRKWVVADMCEYSDEDFKIRLGELKQELANL